MIDDLYRPEPVSSVPPLQAVPGIPQIRLGQRCMALVELCSNQLVGPFT